MDKNKKIALIVIAIFLFIGIIGSSGLENKNTEGNSNNVQKEKQIDNKEVREVKQKLEEITKSSKEELEDRSEETEKVSRFTVLSGIENDPDSDAYGEVVVQEINVWEEAGSGGPNNVAVGRIPHNTKVEIIENKEVEGNTFYKVRSSVGKVSVLPTDFNLRKKRMEELPENEWFVPADETFPVEGWVIDSFVTEITEE